VKVTAVRRRLELLKLEGLGFSPPQIVTELSQKYQFSGRTVYRDFESRGQWQPELQNVKNHTQILMRTVNRYEQIYREASVRFVQDSDSSLYGSNLRIFETGYEFLKNVSLRIDALLIFSSNTSNIPATSCGHISVISSSFMHRKFFRILASKKYSEGGVALVW
jgi:hypothetical protein